MKLNLRFIAIFCCLFFVFQSANCQDFGDFDLESLKNENKNFRQAIESSEKEGAIDWDSYNIISATDGYYIEYYFTLNPKIQRIKMEGEVSNANKVGKWKLYSKYENVFYVGEFKDNLKNGSWIGYYVDNLLDTLVVDSLFFENDKIFGERKEFFKSGELKRITNYFNNEKNGKQIVYEFSFISKVIYLSSIKNFKNNLLDGVQVEFNYESPFDTLRVTEYSDGKLNGLFYEKLSYYVEKTFINYSMNRLEGRFQKFYKNGILKFDLEFKNNLPYTLYANNDSLGNPIDTNKFVNGTGVLNLYNSSGKLLSSFTYENQFLNGKFEIFNRDGKILERGFLYGSLDSVYTIIDVYKHQDINLYSAWQMRFLSNSKSIAFRENDSTKFFGESKFDNVLNTYIMHYKYLDENGLLEKELKTAYRLMYGKFIEYYPNANVKSINNYTLKSVNDSVVSFLEGKSLYYFENANIRAEINYSNGKEVGTSCFYCPNSMLVRIKVTTDDGTVYNIFNGDTVNVTDRNGLKQGKWISLKESKFYGNYDNKTPYETQYFFNDRPMGEWLNYYTFNQKSKNKKYNLRQKLIWQNDTVAYCREWYPDGRIKSEGYLLNFQKDGLWTEYSFRNKREYKEVQYLWGEKVEEKTKVLKRKPKFLKKKMN